MWQFLKSDSIFSMDSILQSIREVHLPVSQPYLYLKLPSKYKQNFTVNNQHVFRAAFYLELKIFQLYLSIPLQNLNCGQFRLECLNTIRVALLVVLSSPCKYLQLLGGTLWFQLMRTTVLRYSEQFSGISRQPFLVPSALELFGPNLHYQIKTWTHSKLNRASITHSFLLQNRRTTQNCRGRKAPLFHLVSI